MSWACRLCSVLLCLALLMPALPVQAASQLDLHGPLGSGEFGESVTVLPNGNLVVTDPLFSNGTTQHVGAVYLYDGATGALISTLTGSTAEDQVGSNGVTVLKNGNYLVLSPNWQNLDAQTALSTPTEPSTPTDAPTPTPSSAHSMALDVGAVTWGNGTTGINGVVGPNNSLVGSTRGDGVGNGGVTVLSNGNYVVSSPNWQQGTGATAGAVTWGSGVTGVTGAVSSSNSLVATAANDLGQANPPQDGQAYQVVSALNNGNYIVSSPNWHNKTGAVTWGNGTTGITGEINSHNSLIGNLPGDAMGSGPLTTLSNGNYVVSSPAWDNGTGAVTWGNGVTGVSGIVSNTNSLVGSVLGDWVGAVGAFSVNGVTALNNGNYVVTSAHWHNGLIPDAGAVTWGNGATGVKGVISHSNSLVGSAANDQVGSGAKTELGVDDYNAVTALSNGNYVVSSPFWDNGAATDAGAVTWGNGATGISGVITSTNSLIGASASDKVGSGLFALNNGNYVVASPHWDNGAVADVGAVTWGNGILGVHGLIITSNSLIGSTLTDLVGGDMKPSGQSGVTVLSNGSYVVFSPNWDNGAVTDAGAVTWGNGANGVRGSLNNNNSVLGGTASGGNGLNFIYDTVHQQVVVGRPADNLVTLFRPSDNSLPLANGDAYAVDEDKSLTVSAAQGLLANDSIPTQRTLTAIKVTDPSHGALTFQSDGSFTYMPAANYSGLDSFTYKANDSITDSNVAMVTITINHVNHAPVVADQSITTAVGIPLALVLKASDADNDLLSYAVVDPPQNGVLTGNAPTLLYTPAVGFVGADSFTYKADDGKLDSTVAKVTITVMALGPTAPSLFLPVVRR